MRRLQALNLDVTTIEALFRTAQCEGLSASYTADCALRAALDMAPLPTPTQGRPTTPEARTEAQERRKARAAKQRRDTRIERSLDAHTPPYCNICENDFIPGDPCPKCGH